MLYYFLKFIIRAYTRIFFRNPLILNSQNVPQNVPLIIASNHPNALCDPCSIAVFSKQRVHFLARGDVFQNKILYSIFVKQLGMVPIFRLSEGVENLHKNEETFRISADKLRMKKSILMFSEGICVQERRLRKLKKGTARIAFASEESAEWNLGLKIIPVGLNYNRPYKFRSDLVINYGKPFEVSQFKELYKNDPAIAINKFTHHLQQELSQLVVHIDNPENDELILQLEEMLGNEFLLDKTSGDYFRQTQKIVSVVNNAGESIAALKEKIQSYFQKIYTLKIEDNSVAKFSLNQISFFSFLLDALLLFIGLPAYIFGLANNYFPHRLGFLLARKIVKQVEFFASVHLYSSAMLYLIFYPVQVLAVALLFRNWYILAGYVILLPLSGIFALSYYEFAKKKLNDWRFLFSNKNQREEIIKIRKEIIEEIKKIIKF